MIGLEETLMVKLKIIVIMELLGFQVLITLKKMILYGQMKGGIILN